MKHIQTFESFLNEAKNEYIIDYVTKSTDLITPSYLKDIKTAMSTDAIDITHSCTLDEYHPLAEKLSRLNSIKQFSDSNGDPFFMYEIDGRKIVVMREGSISSLYGSKKDLSALLYKY